MRRPSPGKTRGHRALRILLAEDNIVNQKLAVALLRNQGHSSVDVVNNGKEAVAAYRAGAFDLVLLDVQMPEMDGFEATAALRALDAATGMHTPIIALTASAMKGDRERCIDAGMDAYVTKPLALNELLDAFERVLPELAAQPANVDEGLSIDWDEALQRVDGDRQLLAEVARLFLDEAPRKMIDLRRAVALREAKTLEHVAHSLRGSASVFGAEEMMSAAHELELMARAGTLARSDAALAYLERKMVAFNAELARFAGAP